MKPTVRRLRQLALLAIFCFGVALGVGAYLFALIFAVEAAACHDLSSLDEMRRHAGSQPDSFDALGISGGADCARWAR